MQTSCMGTEKFICNLAAGAPPPGLPVPLLPVTLNLRQPLLLMTSPCWYRGVPSLHPRATFPSGVSHHFLAGFGALRCQAGVGSLPWGPQEQRGSCVTEALAVRGPVLWDCSSAGAEVGMKAAFLWDCTPLWAALAALFMTTTLSPQPVGRLTNSPTVIVMVGLPRPWEDLHLQES